MISRGLSMWCWASSEMWTRPSTPSRISTKAPKVTTLVTLPSSSSPIVGIDYALPRIPLGLLEAQGDPLALAVDVEHLDGYLVADVEDLARVIDVRPGQFGDVDQAADPVEVHERAEVDDVGDVPSTTCRAAAGRGSARDPPCASSSTARDRRRCWASVELDHLALDRRPHVLVEVGGRGGYAG